MFLNDAEISLDPVPDMVLGFTKEGKRIKINDVTATTLAEELRGTLQGTARLQYTKEGKFDIFPPEKRIKDIGSSFVSSNVLLESKRLNNRFLVKDAKLGKKIKEYESLFDKELVYQNLDKKVVLADFSKTVISDVKNVGSVGRAQSFFGGVTSRGSRFVSPSKSSSVLSGSKISNFVSGSKSPSLSVSSSASKSGSSSLSSSKSFSVSASKSPFISKSPSGSVSQSPSLSGSPSVSFSGSGSPSGSAYDSFSPSPSPISPIGSSGGASFLGKDSEESSSGLFFGFQAFVKRKGKFKAVSPVVKSRISALDIGADVAKRTLAATFQVKAVKGVRPVELKTSGEFQRFQNEFRDYAIRQTRRIPLSDTYIQKRQYRLGTKSEVSEIQKAKKNKNTRWF